MNLYVGSAALSNANGLMLSGKPSSAPPPSGQQAIETALAVLLQTVACLFKQDQQLASMQEQPSFPAGGWFTGPPMGGGECVIAPLPMPMQTGTAPAGGGEPPATGAAKPGSSGQSAPTESVSAVLAGDAKHLASANEKCPAGVTMEQMMKADGGLLASMGNQELRGDGAKGITGGIKDNLAKKSGGTGANDIGTNRDVTWRALRNAQAFKNETGSDGKEVSAEVRHNGNLSGYNSSGEVDRGSNLGEMQDWFKGAISGPNEKLPEGDRVHSDGTMKSGGEMVGDKIGGFFKGIGNHIVNVFKGIGTGIGHVFSGLGNGIKNFFTGHPGDALRDMVGGFKDGFHDVAQPLRQLPATIVNSLGLKDTKFGQFVNGLTEKASHFVDNAFDNTVDLVAKPFEHFGDFEDHLVRGDTGAALDSLKQAGITGAELAENVAPAVLTGGTSAVLTTVARSLVKEGIKSAAEQEVAGFMQNGG